MNFIKQLNQYVTAVFENDESFMREFLQHTGADELLEFYMASERCKVAFLTEGMSTVSTSIRTDEFIAWFDKL